LRALYWSGADVWDAYWALGLKEAKELVEVAPRPVKDNLARPEAEALKQKLEEGGARVSLR
jgi:large subunit ribosomal protein L7/L12